MGKVFNRQSADKPWDYRAETKEQLGIIKEYKDIARAKSLKLPDTEDKPNLLDRLLGAVSAFETAPAAMEYKKTGDPGKALDKYFSVMGKRLTFQGLGDEATYQDVLKESGMAEGKLAGPVTERGVVGLAGDILLDPTTYIGVGLLGRLAKGLSKPAVKVAKAIPGVAKAAKKLKPVAESAEELFKPYAKIKRLPGETGEQYVEKLFKPFAKGLRAEQKTAVEEVAKLSTKAQKTLGRDIGEKLTTAIESGKSMEGAEGVQKIIGDWVTEIAKEEKSRGILKSELPNYVRHLITPEAREFIGTGGKISGEYFKPIKVALGAGKQRKLVGTISEINEKFSKEYGYKLFEPDVFKAVAGRKVESLKAIRTHDFLREVEEKFGIKADKKVNRVLKDGMEYTEYLPKGKIRFYPTETGLGVTGKVKKVLLPKPITDHLNETVNLLSSDEATGKLIKVYDKLLNTWKGSVTGLFPAFHGRNALGGMFNNWIAGVKDPLRYVQGDKLARGVDESITLAGKKYTYKELNEVLTKRGGIGEQGFLDVMGTVEDATKKAFAGPKKQALGKVREALPGKSWMNFIENRLRGSLFVDQLAKGKNVDDAVKSVFKFHFDYAPEGLTKFEGNVMKRLVPFYTWTRNNIPLQIGQMIDQPGKYASVSKTLRSLSGRTEEDRKDIESLPDYMKKSFPVQTGKIDKFTNFLYGFGLPVEDLGRTSVSDVLSRLSPLIKVPIELATDKHFYFDKPISEVTQAPKLMSKAPQAIKSLVGYTEVKSGGKEIRRIDPVRWHILSSLFGRWFYTLDKLFDPEIQASIRVLYATLGIKGGSVSIEQQKYFKEREVAKELGEFLYKKGAVKSYQSYYK